MSTLALLALAISSSKAVDGDGDHPTVWIELGGQLQKVGGEGDAFAPAFIAVNSSSVVFNPISPLDAERAPKFAVGAQGKISFEPMGTDWIFSASALYGRASGDKHVRHQTYTYPGHTFSGAPQGYNYVERFADTKALQNEVHAIIDFKAGKDIGLGMLGRNGVSVLSFGARFAQFSSRTQVSIEARPDLHATPGLAFQDAFHDYTAMAESRRSFRGAGPSLSWDASAPVVGSQDDGEIALDWGASAAVLFGRQKVSEQHSTTTIQHIKKYYVAPVQQAGNSARARFVAVPNIGGFAGISFNYSAAKVSFGYRGDFFFGAVDGGWDATHRENLSFHGPYATISVGLGG